MIVAVRRKLDLQNSAYIHLTEARSEKIGPRPFGIAFSDAVNRFRSTVDGFRLGVRSRAERIDPGQRPTEDG